MPSIRFRPRRSRRRLASLSLAAAVLWAFPALAGDKPATPEGADALRALIAKYLPAAQAGATPLVTVKPEGSHYLVSADLSALNALLAETGISYDPAVIVYQAVEQDDGNWRVAMDSLPRIGFHSKDATGAIELTNFRSAALISPAIAWLLSGSANIDKGTFQVQNPKITQTIDFGPVQETIATNVGGDGSVSTQVKEEIAELGLKAVGAGDDDEASDQFQRQGGKGADQSWRRRLQEPQGVRPLGPACGSPRARRPRQRTRRSSRACSRSWRRPASSSTRGSKRRRPSSPLRSARSLLGDFKYQLGAANAGPQSAIDLSVSADGLSLPVGLLPPNAGALTPSVRSTLRRNSRESTSPRPPTSGSPTSASRATDRSSPTTTRRRSRPLSSARVRSRSSSPPRMWSRRRSTPTSPA